MPSSDARRTIPSVDSLLRSAPGARASKEFGRALLKRTLTDVLRQSRADSRRGRAVPPDDELLAAAIHAASSAARGLTPVINATGVVLHTNLGRAPLPARAARAAARAGTSYTDLEIDRESGSRGRRDARAALMLSALTGAEAATVVNNCAAALVLALATLAKGKDVLVSRGELIEIGGEFRIPDIMAASGAKLVEVGTTNRTRAADYRGAIGSRTAAILKVHPSNYRVVGFTASVPTSELAGIAKKASLPFVFDVGSGLVDLDRGGAFKDEPTAEQALVDGADLVTFSGDKLLGGPQAGCIVGRAELIERLRRNPFARAVRVDQMQLAALEQVLAMHLSGDQPDLPVHSMIHEPADKVRSRAQQLSEMIGGELEHARVEKTGSVVGGGSAPGTSVPSWGVSVRVADPSAFAARLRAGSPAVVGRIEDGRVLLDLRTVRPDELPHLARAVLYAIEGDDLDED